MQYAHPLFLSHPFLSQTELSRSHTNQTESQSITSIPLHTKAIPYYIYPDTPVHTHHTEEFESLRAKQSKYAIFPPHLFYTALHISSVYKEKSYEYKQKISRISVFSTYIPSISTLKNPRFSSSNRRAYIKESVSYTSI